ncbi:uncharacterized protein FIBRA_05868 [Fibroporia radiculosa]|uniref:Ketoreductase (KR) domain-containing protein n=1 Tax=Fibroporia radiculosa TaxID=599839 RepID=J4HY87_9APHY|nr:uncharacterized protein FIBRA_05868 [Fibroporia radiculosa]CCM03722.1 predicted protein [Fibroporia radiculosa]
MIPFQTDVTDRDSLRSLAAEVKSRHGHVNLLVNNAGVMLGHQPQLPKPADTSIAAYQELLWNTEDFDSFGTSFRVNVSGVWFCTVAFLELLHAGNKSEWARTNGVTSQVLTISSLASLRRDSGVFSLSYSLSKAATTHLSKVVAHYLKDWKILVSCPDVSSGHETNHLYSTIYRKNSE